MVAGNVKNWGDLSNTFLTNFLASNSMMAIANCNSGVKSCHWQVCSIQRQVAFLYFFTDPLPLCFVVGMENARDSYSSKELFLECSFRSEKKYKRAV